TSTVLSRGPVATAACSLHALTTTCSGTRGRAVTCATVRAGFLTAGAGAAAVSSGFDRLAITIPVTSAVVATRAMPMAVNFQGLRVICVTRSVIDLSLSANLPLDWCEPVAGMHRPCQIRIEGFPGSW